MPKRKRNTKFRFDKRTNTQRTFGYCPKCGKWFRHVTVRIDPVPLLDEVYWNYFVGCADWPEFFEDGEYDMVCDECGKPFTLTVNASYSYDTERAEDEDE